MNRGPKGDGDGSDLQNQDSSCKLLTRGVHSNEKGEGRNRKPKGKGVSRIMPSVSRIGESVVGKHCQRWHDRSMRRRVSRNDMTQREPLRGGKGIHRVFKRAVVGKGEIVGQVPSAYGLEERS